jgi:acetyltransferase
MNASFAPTPSLPPVRRPPEAVEFLSLEDGTPVTIRPIRPGDLELVRAFDAGLSPATRQERWHGARKLTPEELRRLTEIDHDREVALIAVAHAAGGEREIGVARYVRDRDGEGCEFALVVADGVQRRGLGERLLRGLVRTAAARGIAVVCGVTSATNARMVALARKLGFRAARDPRDGTMMELRLPLGGLRLQAA